MRENILVRLFLHPFPWALSATLTGSVLGILMSGTSVFASTRITLPNSDRDRKPATLYIPSETVAALQTPVATEDPRPRLAPGNASAKVTDKTPARPLVVLLHAYPSTGPLENWYMGLSDWVDRRDFDLLLPEGTENKWRAQFWNATDSCCDSYHSQVDDVGYLQKLIESVIQTQNIDRNRVYLIGHSAGGYMVNRMACESGETFAGLVSFAGGGYLNESLCKHPTANNFLQIHAANDGNVAIDSDVGHLDYAGGIQMVANWQKRNHCSESLQPSERLDLIKAIRGDDTQAWHATGCANGKDVYFWKIDAHTAPFYIPHVPALNPVTPSLILDFLFKHSRTDGAANPRT